MPDLRDLSWLPADELHDWVVQQRWFASKSREVTQINVTAVVPLRTDGSPLLVLALMEVVFSAGTHETYQWPLGLRPAGEGWDSRGIVADVSGWTVYDGFADPAVGCELLHRMRSNSELGVDEGTLGFHW